MLIGDAGRVVASIQIKGQDEFIAGPRRVSLNHRLRRLQSNRIMGNGEWMKRRQGETVYWCLGETESLDKLEIDHIGDTMVTMRRKTFVLN